MQHWACRLAFIECMIHRDDCSKELLEWGSRVQGAPTATLTSVMWHGHHVSQHCILLKHRAHTKHVLLWLIKLVMFLCAA